MQLTRRQMIGAAAAASVGSLIKTSQAAVVPPAKYAIPGEIKSQFKLSMATYSFNKHLGRGEKKGTMTLLELLDYAAIWRLTAIEPTAYYFASEEPAYIHSLKAKAFKLGLDISGLGVGNNFVVPAGAKRDEQIAYVKKWIGHAAILGAPCIRIFAGQKSKEADRAAHRDWVIECIKPCCDAAGEKGIFLALENHGYLTETADEVLGIVDDIKHEWLGINLDTGNFTADPYKNIAKAAAKAITSHLKVHMIGPDGKTKVECDFEKIFQVMREANYRGYFSLEYEAQEDPLTGVPKTLDKIRKAMTA